MPLTLEQHDMVESELKRFCTDLNLSEDQEAFKRVQKISFRTGQELAHRRSVWSHLFILSVN
jgi:hypothetical protein